ncbi:DivIVA domain-containing protein [Kitasatospora sp. DSM 101779]|uniref:DivIVA domain-containing protein n=1 Tax=Kitasatospora sp. DSM 101779 TaxID=2853165 RepID=UPI0021D8369A|nr:DivIVA domain-containing protein [Kitasatospora sp. DSM 101779]MCU7823003.1 DivIVA domain-containing protein [Kitasatospora sp. DSM 101779]
MFWVIVAAMAVVVGGAALVALGGGGTLPEALPDRITARLPQDRPLGRHDVDELRLPMALRGYRMDEVDNVLDRLGAELALRDMRIAELEAAAVVRGAVELAPGQPQDEPLPGLEAFAAVVGPAAAPAPAEQPTAEPSADEQPADGPAPEERPADPRTDLFKKNGPEQS